MEKCTKASVQKLIGSVRERLGERVKAAEIFERCYADTLKTTVKEMEDGTVYVITGDIPAMWLRDSSAQLHPYLAMAGECGEIRRIITGLVKRQMKYIGIDPYANAFNEEPNGRCWSEDETKENPWVWERKFEVDSLCYPVWLAWQLWKSCGCTVQFDEEFKKGVEIILKVFKTEQRHEQDSEYRFIRRDAYFKDTLSREGKGALTRPGTGMIWSGFRPSDDACTYGYLIPSNMFAAVILGYIQEISEKIWNDEAVRKEAEILEKEIRDGIEHFGITEKPGYGRVYAYETDGYGQFCLIDDANVPSLLSMKYIGYTGKDREVEENTRRLILSEENQYFYSGSSAAGIGSAHTPAGYIWHIALAMQGLTGSTLKEKLEILDLMVRNDGGTGFMHEGFFKDDPCKYTREWFSWANALFCELVLDCCGLGVQMEDEQERGDSICF